MTWVKQNYDRFLLALFALALLACAGVLFNNARGFSSIFDAIHGAVPEGKKIPQADQAAVDKNVKELQAPQAWEARMTDKRRLPVFVSVPYIEKGDEIIELSGTSGLQLHPPVPNTWLLENNQDLLSPNVLEQDSDGDGFSAFDEWKGGTNPLDKNSHPAYTTKLILEKIIRIPFRLRFEAYNGSTYQVNIVDVEDAPTVFVKLNQMVGDTKFKVVKFEKKMGKDPETKANKDVSELTVEDMESHEKIVLPKTLDVDSPKTYAQLDYLWNGKKFGVTKNFEFSIAPEDSIKYKCLDLNDTSVTVVREKDNKKMVITKDGMAEAK